VRAQKSIVVLPFQNISKERKHEYFADGLTEELINTLSRIQELKVTARTSAYAYKHQSEDVRKIGKDLGVALALEGSTRLAGSRVRVSVQLVRTKDGFQIWSERYDLDFKDIFQVQDEICLTIADQIREHFGHFVFEDQLVTSATESMDAYSSFLEARYHQLKWNVDHFQTAIRLYERCLQLDPTFHQAHYGLVQCYGMLATWGAMGRGEAMTKADQHFTEGFKLNPHNFEAYFAIANKAMWVEWKPNKALGRLNQALALKPHDPEALEASAECYLALGDFEQAGHCIDRAIDVNPLSANHFFIQGNIHYYQGQFQEAMACYAISLQIDTEWEMSRQAMALTYVLTEDRPGLGEFLFANPHLKDVQFFGPLFDALHHGKKMPLEALEESTDTYLPWKFWALWYAGEEEKALEQLQFGIDNQLSQYIYFAHDPVNRPLKSNETFIQLAERVFDKLPAAPLPADKVESPLISPADQLAYATKLNKLMTEDRVYTEPSLTLRKLSAKMELNTNKLSWLINEVIGKNFNEYVNGLRLEAFKKNAASPNYREYSLLGIALDCGFNSKSVFNEFFKKQEGITPSAWLKMQKE